jgi:hypothetical protein
MDEQQSNEQSADASELSLETVTLIIDYGNGAQKSFASIPWRQGMDVLEVLGAAESINPGLAFEFSVTLESDRAGRQRGFIASIDGVEADQTNQEWLIRIHDRFEGSTLATAGAFGRADPQIDAGDVIELRRTAGQ